MFAAEQIVAVGPRDERFLRGREDKSVFLGSRQARTSETDEFSFSLRERVPVRSEFRLQVRLVPICRLCFDGHLLDLAMGGRCDVSALAIRGHAIVVEDGRTISSASSSSRSIRLNVLCRSSARGPLSAQHAGRAFRQGERD